VDGLIIFTLYFIGIDESTKSTKRSFVEIEIGGKLCSTDPDLHIWCVPLTVKEVVSHSTEKIRVVPAEGEN